MKFKIIILLFISLLCSTSVLAQVNSPYSRIGIGNIIYDYSAKRLGMGQVGVSIADKDFINTINPAGLYRLNLTRFETSFKYNGEIISADAGTKFYADAGFNGFAFGFPVSALYGIGTAIGIVPVSSINYEVVDRGSGPAGDFTTTYQGKGGLSKMFAAASYRLPFNLNIGASLDYYFGNLSYSTGVNFNDQSSYDANYELERSLSGLGTTIGLISPDLSTFFKSEIITDFTIGAAINLVSDLSVDTMIVAASRISMDTISSGTAKMNLPYRLTVGASVVLSNYYLISMDYIYQPWEEYSIGSKKSNNLRNVSKLSAGFEFKPVRAFDKTFWEQISFRAGLSFEQTQYVINGNGIDELSISGGFSLPISFDNSLTIGLELGMRSAENSELVDVKFYKLNVGLNIGELWFVRRER